MDDRVTGAVRRYFEAVTAPDGDAFAALFTDAAAVEDPVGTPPLVGPADLAKFHRRLHRAWQALAMTPGEVYVRGDAAAAHWTAAGTSAGGNRVEFAGINVFEVAADGRIARLAAYWDLEGVVARF